MWQYGLPLAHEIKTHLLLLVAFYFAVQPLALNSFLDRGIRLLTVGAMTIQVVRLVSELCRILIEYSRGGFSADDPVVRNTNNNLATLVKIAVWVAGILFFLDNAGFNVSTFIAGLGIGGVAIALAAQAILGDTFSSFAIALDKPFEAGDVIVVDNMRGRVEHVGLKTTRVRSVRGELLIFANSDLTKSRIRNFKRMEQRHAEFRVLVHPATPLPLIRKVPDLISEIISRQALVKLDFAKFVAIQEGGLLFEAGYFIASPLFSDFAEARQAITFAVLETFQERGIVIAFPANPTSPQPTC
jgi:small-conductance mechanosensitive channel